MKLKTVLFTCAFAVAAATAAQAADAPAAKPAAKAKVAYKTPRTAWGAPDLQGTWTNVTVTPLERPASFGTRKAMTEKEVADREGRAMENVLYENQPTDPNQGSTDKTRKNCQGAGGRDCGYNAGWKDETTKVMRVGGEPRTSFITSTPDGRVPPRIGRADAGQAARERLAADGENAVQRAGMSDNPETRGLGERCIAFGNSAGPILPNGYYNNNIQIFQSKDAVAIELEMVHEVRNVRIGGKHRTDGVRPWFGDSVGHWEGDTLVVETTNYHPQTSYRGASANLFLTERFTRVAKDRVLYQFTVKDPTVWAQPWGGEYEFYPTVGAMYEYACHEGNYGLEGILAGARHEEEEARAAKEKPVASR